MRFSNCGGVYILTVPEDEDVMRRGLKAVNPVPGYVQIFAIST
jgi:hypothetical protein